MGSLVVLSGGQDSTTALFWAKKHFGDPCHAITFDYKQKHQREVVAAAKIAKMAGVASHEVIKLPAPLRSTSPLVDMTVPVAKYESVAALPGGIEPTFVPGRNALFLVIAANRAVAVQQNVLVMGVCEADFGGYPDCRQTFIDAMAVALSEGLFGGPGRLTIHTPLMRLTKKQTVELANSLPGCSEAIAQSHTCYNGTEVPCLRCHACLIRARGFHGAGVGDPLIERLLAETKMPPETPIDGYFDSVGSRNGGGSSVGESTGASKDA